MKTHSKDPSSSYTTITSRTGCEMMKRDGLGDLGDGRVVGGAAPAARFQRRSGG